MYEADLATASRNWNQVPLAFILLDLSLMSQFLHFLQFLHAKSTDIPATQQKRTLI